MFVMYVWSLRSRFSIICNLYVVWPELIRQSERVYRMDRYESLVDAVYTRRGWTSDGIPTPEHLAGIGMDLPECSALKISWSTTFSTILRPRRILGSAKRFHVAMV